MVIAVPALTEPQTSFVILDKITVIVKVSTARTFRTERESFCNRTIVISNATRAAELVLKV
jgi:hypothetical protein